MSAKELAVYQLIRAHYLRNSYRTMNSIRTKAQLSCASNHCEPSESRIVVIGWRSVLDEAPAEDTEREARKHSQVLPRSSLARAARSRASN